MDRYALIGADGSSIGPFGSHAEAVGYMATEDLSRLEWSVSVLQAPYKPRVTVIRRLALVTA